MENYYKTFARSSEYIRKREICLAIDQYRNEAIKKLIEYSHPDIYLSFGDSLYMGYLEANYHDVCLVNEMNLTKIHFAALFDSLEDFRELYINETEKEYV